MRQPPSAVPRLALAGSGASPTSPRAGRSASRSSCSSRRLCRCRRSCRAAGRRRSSTSRTTSTSGLGEVEPHYWVESVILGVLLLAVLHGAALDEAARGRGRPASRRRPRRWWRRSSRRGSRTRRACSSFSPASAVRCARHPRKRGRGPPVRVRRAARGAAGGELVVLEGSGHLPHARDPSRSISCSATLSSRFRGRRAGCAASRAASAPTSPPPSARARAARCRDRGRAAQAPISTSTGSRQHPVIAALEARGERIHPASAKSRERVDAHRERVGRARPPLLPGHPPDGRDPARELHGLPRPRPRGAVRPLDRRRGVGVRLLPAREPGAEARGVRGSPTSSAGCRWRTAATASRT